MYTDKERDVHIFFLIDLIIDQAYVAFICIAKISYFNEYSMLDDKEYLNYFGSEDQEILDRCNKNDELFKYYFFFQRIKKNMTFFVSLFVIF